MKRLRIVLITIVVVMVFVLSGCQVGCSRNDDNSSSSTNNNTSNSTSVNSAQPLIPTMTYQDEINKVVNNVTVPQEYEVPAEHQGTLLYEYYNTRDYDDDEHAMSKYVEVYLPYGYDPNKEYDILYFVHGHEGNAESLFGAPGDPGESKHLFDHLIEDGKVRPMIAVAMSYYDDNRNEGTTDYDATIINGFGPELRNDIIPLIESKYSTYAKSTDFEGLKASRNHRIMSGFSMGGVTTCLQMCESMDYFKYYMPMSGSLLWSSDAYPNRGSYDAGGKMKESIVSQGYGPDDFCMYISTGTADFSMNIVERQVASMKQQTDMFTFGMPGENGVNCTYGLGFNEGHNGHCMETSIYNALPTISALIGIQ